jgi:hypothetical protein
MSITAAESQITTGRVPTVLTALFGIALCVYSYYALGDMRAHIESNWKKAGYVLDGNWNADWGGRKSRGWRVLLIVGVRRPAQQMGSEWKPRNYSLTRSSSGETI